MMTLRNLTLAAILFALGGLSFAEPVPQDKKKAPEKAKPSGVLWRTDYNAARKEAVDRQRPIVIVVYRSDNTPSAKLFIRISEHVELTSFLNSRVIPLKIDGPKEGQLAERLGIYLFPTLVLADCDGKIRDTISGYQDPDELLAKLRKTFPESK